MDQTISIRQASITTGGTEKFFSEVKKWAIIEFLPGHVLRDENQITEA